MRILLSYKTYTPGEPDVSGEPTSDVEVLHEHDFYREIMRSPVGDIVDLAYESKHADGTALSMELIESTFEWIHGIDLSRKKISKDERAAEFEARDTTSMLSDPDKLRSVIGTVFLAMRREDPNATYAQARALPFVDITWRYDMSSADLADGGETAPKAEAVPVEGSPT